MLLSIHDAAALRQPPSPSHCSPDARAINVKLVERMLATAYTILLTLDHFPCPENETNIGREGKR